VKNVRRQSKECVPGNTKARWQMSLGLKFLVNNQLKRFEQREKEEEKIAV
jgi:hypothetical protein